MTEPTLDLEDIQGNLLRGYRMPLALHIAFAFGPVPAARRLIGRLAGDGANGLPQVSTAARWQDRPAYALNLGLTFAGLQKLGVPQAVLERFPASFALGPAWPDRARALGDTDISDPQHWELGAPGDTAVHLLLSINARLQSRLDELAGVLCKAFIDAGATEVWRRQAEALPQDRVHFGYRDGIAQPRIRGVDERRIGAAQSSRNDAQPEAPAGDFLLGRRYVNSYGGNFLGDLPPALGDNATYGAFRVLRQDAAAFERVLQRNARRWKIDDPEWLAAKMMGRWRSGAPLMCNPDRDPGARPGLDADTINDFDYAPGRQDEQRYDDVRGLRCPAGAHIRRLNPRGGMAMGQPHTRRIVRRAMPYGPEYVAGDGQYLDDGVDRGLLGYFLCGDLAMQFEFLQSVWANQDLSACGLRGTRDPILGAHPAEGGRFVIRTDDRRDPIVITDLPRLVSTRGALYCLLPGIGGLRHLASLT